jgi:hypothetical protein
MNATLPPLTPIVDRDRHRACRLAHAFGASIAAALALLLAAAAQFPAPRPSLPVLLTAGSVVAAAAGFLADLAVRPARVIAQDGWLTVSRLGRRHWVRIDRLVELSANPHAAGSVILADEDGNRADVDVRCLVRNPLIWQLVAGGVGCSRRRGSLELAGPDSRFWSSVARQVDHAQRKALAALDFEPAD